MSLGDSSKDDIEDLKNKEVELSDEVSNLETELDIVGLKINQVDNKIEVLGRKQINANVEDENMRLRNERFAHTITKDIVSKIIANSSIQIKHVEYIKSKELVGNWIVEKDILKLVVMVTNASEEALVDISIILFPVINVIISPRIIITVSSVRKVSAESVL